MDGLLSVGIVPSFSPTVDLYGTLGATGKATPAQAAREAETLFLSLLLKEMRQSLDEEGSLFAGDKGDIYGGLFDLLMSRHLAESGGLGLATIIGQMLEQPPKPHAIYESRTQPTLSGSSSP